MSTKKTKTPIRPLSVWIVGHTQNCLISETAPGARLAVFYKRKDAENFRREYSPLYRVYKATISRDNYEGDLGILRRDCLALRQERDAVKRLREDSDRMLSDERAAHAETAQKLLDLQKQIRDGEIWNTENPRWTPRTQSALGLAAEEAMACGATYVGTEHVLLGLLKQGEGSAHRHFVASGMTYDKAEYAMRVGRCS